jgi:hypothetical protein
MPRYFLTAVLLTTLVLMFAACSGEAEKKSEPAPAVDNPQVAAIQEALTEAITRWHYGDKSVLYENEFPYLRSERTLEEYLDHRQIKYTNADSVEALRVLDVQFFGSDSADARVEALLVGSRGDTVRSVDVFRLYYFGGRWIKPTLSAWVYQMQNEARRRTADSAAAAEEKDQGW